jgi:NSS family neurotransmitter:Na+ symporter
MNRGFSALIVGVAAWLLGVACALSLNIWADVKIFDNSIFDFFDKLTTNIMLPLGGLLICVFVAWVMDREIVRREVDIDHPTIYRVWFFLVRYVSPVGVAVVMFNKLMA